MFEKEINQDINTKKKKAFLCAVIATATIAIMYLILTGGSLYRFNGIKEDINPVSSFFKQTKQNVSQELEKGKDALNKNN